MITESTIYWITRCDAINTAAGVLCFAAVALSVVSLIATIAATIEDNGVVRKDGVSFFLGCSVAAVLFGTVLVFVPTTKEAALIKVIPAIANSETVQTTIPAEAKELYSLAKQALRDKIKQEAKDE